MDAILTGLSGLKVFSIFTESVNIVCKLSLSLLDLLEETNNSIYSLKKMIYSSSLDFFFFLLVLHAFAAAMGCVTVSSTGLQWMHSVISVRNKKNDDDLVVMSTCLGTA